MLSTLEGNMARLFDRWVPALTMVVALATGGSAEAQELRKDAVANGVLIGAGTGAAAGALFGLTTEEICSPGACAYLGSLTGGLVGLLIDKKLGSPRPVTPGSYIDDGLGNGALIGALSGVGIVLAESRFRCGDKPDKVPCTGKGLLIDSFRAAMWVALAGLIVDAAIPSKLEGPASAPLVQSQRPFGIRFAVRF